VAGVCVEETGFRRAAGHCLRFEESAGSEDAERPEVHSHAEHGNAESFFPAGAPDSGNG
jgi:hypothetical protein